MANIDKEFEMLIRKCVQDGYQHARKKVPFFTDRLFLWAHENGLTEGLAAFVSAYVTGTIRATLEHIVKEREKGKADGTDD